MIKQLENHHSTPSSWSSYSNNDLIFKYAKKSVKIEPISVGLWQLCFLLTHGYHLAPGDASTPALLPFSSGKAEYT